MRRALLALPLLLAVLTCAAPARAQVAAAPPPLKATLAVCSSGPAEAERFAVVTGSMPALRGTVRMAMRFDLLVRSSSRAPWNVVRAKGFGRWERSDPGRAGFVYTKRVERLTAPAEYRAVVRFRWYQGDGTRRERVRRTPLCRQPDQRADLRVAALTVGPGPAAGTTRYRLTVVNAGRTAAPGFDVGLVAPDGEQVRAVPALPAGEQATIDLVAGRCDPARPAQLTLDVRDVVDESSERDNRVFALCPG